jgi:GWxTD domain-containing protein
MTINIPKNEIAFSGIEFLESYNPAEGDNIFVKHGLECVPYVTDFYPKEIKQLNFYAEVYGIAKELGPLEDFLLMFHIENSNTGKPIRNFSSFPKQQAKNVNVVFKSIDIAKLPSGNYHLVMEVRNRQNELVASTRRFFQRSNPDVELEVLDITSVDVEQTFVQSFTNADSLAFFMAGLKPISDQSEARFIDTQLDSVSMIQMQRFFYDFWLKRNEAAPEVAWNNYKFQLDYVQQKFGSTQVIGWDTDRGRIYLQFGAPNSVIVENNEQGAYPYEIWHYYKIADLTDKKFVFYNKNLTANGYELLHSNMMGETNNPLWEQELYSRSSNVNIKGKAKEYFNGN